MLFWGGEAMELCVLKIGADMELIMSEFAWCKTDYLGWKGGKYFIFVWSRVVKE